MNSASRPASVTLLLAGARVPAHWFDDDEFRAGVEATALAQRLRRARLGPPWQDDAPTPDAVAHQRWLLDWLGLNSSGALDAASALADAIPDASFRLHPVSLHAGLDRVRLAALHDVLLPPEQARALAASAEALLAAEGWQIRVAESGRWYLAGAAALQLRTCAPEVALGRSVDAYLPAGTDARRWRRRLSEIEMAWHMHPVNAQRESGGLATINSLWLTGPVPGRAGPDDPIGESMSQPHADALVLTDQPAIAGAATLLGARVADPGAFDDAMLSGGLARGPDGPAGPGGPAGTRPRRVLLVTHDLVAPLLAGDPRAWLSSFEASTGRTLALAMHIARRLSVALEVVLCGDLSRVGASLHASDRWRLWRRGSAEAALGEPQPPRNG